MFISMIMHIGGSTRVRYERCGYMLPTILPTHSHCGLCHASYIQSTMGTPTYVGNEVPSEEGEVG
jgi:hypothetical protein